MKMKVIIFFLMIIICFLTACNEGIDNTDNPQDIVISHNKETINFYSIETVNESDNIKFDLNECDDIPYIGLGKSISIDFGGNLPAECELVDYILNEDGTQKYTEQTIIRTQIDLDDNEVSFILDENFAAFYSSDSKDYEDGAILRGFRLLCSWDDNECEYRFIIRTDASS